VTKISIRQANPNDLEALGFLAPTQKEAGYFERCLAEQADGKRLILIAVQDGAYVGYGMLNWSPQYTLYRKLGIPEIQDLNVISVARRSGVATTLVRYCEKLALDKGCSMMGISVGLTADYGAAQRLYIKLGYAPDGYGVTYDRLTVRHGELRPIDDNLALMLVRPLT
jgi:GNAT superfamily N-acetyltransferase